MAVHEDSDAAAVATGLFKTLLREQPNDVLLWLRSYFAKSYDFDAARAWQAMSAEQRREYIDSLSRVSIEPS